MDLGGLVAALNSAPPELIWALLLVACYGAVLTMQRLFGAAGLYVYVAVAVLVANIQVLKVVQFSVFQDPVALGTIMFASTYLATDILNEHYGRAAARRAVWLGFSALALMTVFMTLTLGFQPLGLAAAGDELAWAVHNHDHMSALFLPQPVFLIAGMTAYLVSQLNDVWLYRWIRGRTGARMLWLRNNASTMVSALIDNVVFSVLAWVVLAPEPLGWEPLIFTYILGTYVLRVAVAALDTPFLYLSRRCVAPADAVAQPA